MDKNSLQSLRPKKFYSMESLWFEEERLATFIDWPVRYISYKDLAAEGFYYLRTKDHCACAFCRGIIGAWEEGDTPRGEHKRHFPLCPFVQGKVTGNVPLALGKILNKLPREPAQKDEKEVTISEDVCGIGKRLPNGLNKGLNKEEVSLKSLGFKEYCGPKRREFLTPESREKSYKMWPERVFQKPKELADAGFYYCGLSDHVRCFHCGNGLRNWEYDDKPWVEHARWYPECNYVLLTKGKDFIDKVQLENPPFLPTFASDSKSRDATGSSVNGASSSSCACSLTEAEIDQLMDLHIIREVIAMGFTSHAVRSALKMKLKQTGLPFFSLEAAIESILVIMEEETKKTISGCEYITSQAKQMAAYRPNETIPSEDIPPMRAQNVSSQRSEDVSSSMLSSYVGPITLGRSELFSSHSVLPPLSPLTSSSPPLRSSTPSSQLENEVIQVDESPFDSGPSSLSGSEEQVNARNERELLNGSPLQFATTVTTPVHLATTTTITPEETSSLVASEVTTTSTTQTEPPTTIVLTASTIQTVSLGESLERNGDDFMMEADEIIEEAVKVLLPPSSSSSSSSSQSSEGYQESSLGDSEEISSQSLDSSEEVFKLPLSKEAELLSKELEKLKENRTCRVCMDKEMDVVFLPCTHMVTCSSCAVALASCPICRKDIKFAFKPIIS